MPTIVIVSLVVLFEIIAMGAILPVLARYGMELGSSKEMIGYWIGTLFFLRTAPKIVMNPLWGKLSDHIGRRWSLTIATTGTIAGSVLWAMSNNLWWLLASQAIVGLFGSQAALVYAVASDVTEPKKRAGAMGMLGAAFGFGMAIGPVIGGFVGHYSLANVGWVCAAFQLISLSLTLFVLKESRPNKQADESEFYQPTRLLELARKKTVWSLLNVVIISTLGYSIMLPTFEILTHNWYGFTTRQTGYAWAVFGVVGIIVQGGLIRPIVKRFGEKITIMTGSAILAIGYGLLSSHPTMPLFWTALVCVGFGSGLMIPALTAMVSHQVASRDQGAVHGLNQGATSLGRGCGYLVGGIMLAQLGPGKPYLAASIIVIAAAVLLALLPMKNVHAQDNADVSPVDNQ